MAPWGARSDGLFQDPGLDIVEPVRFHAGIVARLVPIGAVARRAEQRRSLISAGGQRVPAALDPGGRRRGRRERRDQVRGGAGERPTSGPGVGAGVNCEAGTNRGAGGGGGGGGAWTTIGCGSGGSTVATAVRDRLLDLRRQLLERRGHRRELLLQVVPAPLRECGSDRRSGMPNSSTPPLSSQNSPNGLPRNASTWPPAGIVRDDARGQRRARDRERIGLLVRVALGRDRAVAA